MKSKHTEILEKLADKLINALQQDQQNPTEIPHQPSSIKGPEVGQLWTASATTPNHASAALIYIQKTGPTHCESLLVHDHTWLSCHDDLVLDPYDSPTGDPLVVCLWHPLHIQTENLGEHIDSLSDEISETINLLTNPQHTHTKTAVGHDTLDGAPLIEWEIQRPDGFEQRYLTGTRPLTDADPRLRARTALQNATAPLNNIVDNTDHQLTSPIQHLFERIQQSLDQHPAFIPTPSVGDQKFPALTLNTSPLTHLTDPSNIALTRSSTPETQLLNSNILYEFSLRCGPATVNLCLSTGPTGLTLDGDVHNDQHQPVPGLNILFLQLTHAPSNAIIWQGSSDSFGEISSPPLTLNTAAELRLEITLNDHTITLDF